MLEIGLYIFTVIMTIKFIVYNYELVLWKHKTKINKNYFFIDIEPSESTNSWFVSKRDINRSSKHMINAWNMYSQEYIFCQVKEETKLDKRINLCRKIRGLCDMGSQGQILFWSYVGFYFHYMEALKVHIQTKKIKILQEKDIPDFIRKKLEESEKEVA